MRAFGALIEKRNKLSSSVNVVIWYPWKRFVKKVWNDVIASNLSTMAHWLIEKQPFFARVFLVLRISLPALTWMVRVSSCNLFLSASQVSSFSSLQNGVTIVSSASVLVSGVSLSLWVRDLEADSFETNAGFDLLGAFGCGVASALPTRMEAPFPIAVDEWVGHIQISVVWKRNTFRIDAKTEENFKWLEKLFFLFSLHFIILKFYWVNLRQERF